MMIKNAFKNSYFHQVVTCCRRHLIKMRVLLLLAIILVRLHTIFLHLHQTILPPIISIIQMFGLLWWIQLNPFNGIERYNPVLRANSKVIISPIVMTLACLSYGFPNNMKYAFCLSFMFCKITKIMSEHRAKSTFKLRITPIVRTLRWSAYGPWKQHLCVRERTSICVCVREDEKFICKEGSKQLASHICSKAIFLQQIKCQKQVEWQRAISFFDHVIYYALSGSKQVRSEDEPITFFSSSPQMNLLLWDHWV